MKKNFIIIIAIASIIMLIGMVQYVFADTVDENQLSLDDTTNGTVTDLNSLNNINGQNTVKNNTNIIAPTNINTNTNNVANNTLAKAGLDGNGGIIMIAICTISAIYAFKKINEYKTK